MSSSATPGAYQRWLALIVALLLPCAIAILVMVAQWHGLQRPAPLELAVVARRLATGQGFTTSIVTPRSLAFNDSLQQHPELRIGPLAVAPAALLYKLLPASGDKPFVFSSMLAWLLTLGLAVLGARALFGRRTGLLAMLLLLFSPAFVSLAISADGRCWAMPLLVMLWIVLASPGSGARKGAVAGLLLGLACLVSYAFVLPLLCLVVPALARTGGAAAPPKSGPDDEPTAASSRLDLPAIGLATLVALVVVTPWLVRNQRVAGTPLPMVGSYDLANYTPESPGRSIERRYLDPGASPARFALTHKRQLFLKSLTGLHNLAGGLGQLIDWPLLGLFLAALFMPLAGERGRARRAVAVGLLLQVLLLALCSQEFGLLSYWTPLLAIWGAWFLAERVATLYTHDERLPWYARRPATARRVAIGALLLVLALPGLGPQISGRNGQTADPSAPNWLVLKSLPGDGAIATDDPWHVAWHTDRTCVWLPQSTDDLKAIDGDHRLAAIYFSRLAMPGGAFADAERAPWWSWAQVMPSGFLNFRPIDSRVDGERILIVPW